MDQKREDSVLEFVKLTNAGGMNDRLFGGDTLLKRLTSYEVFLAHTNFLKNLLYIVDK
jgi:hypothetical protein